jgi:hypothetical protein
MAIAQHCCSGKAMMATSQMQGGSELVGVTIAIGCLAPLAGSLPPTMVARAACSSIFCTGA